MLKIFSREGLERMTSTSLTLDSLVHQLGYVGKRLSDLGAAEGSAGNLSICFRGELDLSTHFPEVRQVDLPVPASHLEGATLIVTGSGRRLRQILEDPGANLACIVVETGGETGKMFTAPECPFARVTSEFNSHLAVHHDQMPSREIPLHAILHAQPLHLTYLSHLKAYQDETYLNRHLMRWQPETIFHFPEGLGVVPFLLPGSAQLTAESTLALREHRIVVWSQHGVMIRADGSLEHALDLLEYAETAAHYEYLNLTAGGLRAGLSPQRIRDIARHWNVRQNIF